MDACMQVESITSKRILFHFFQTRLMGNHFILDLRSIPLDGRRRIVVHRRFYHVLHEYSMSWSEFLKQPAIGSVALIPWRRFHHRIVRV